MTLAFWRLIALSLTRPIYQHCLQEHTWVTTTNPEIIATLLEPYI
jgi:hypothetical protein